MFESGEACCGVIVIAHFVGSIFLLLKLRRRLGETYLSRQLGSDSHELHFYDDTVMSSIDRGLFDVSDREKTSGSGWPVCWTRCPLLRSGSLESRINS